MGDVVARRSSKRSKEVLAGRQQQDAAGASADGRHSQRRPLGVESPESPYSQEQYRTLQAVFVDAAKTDCFDQYWPQIRDAARKCARDVELQKLRKPNPVVWRPLERAVKRGDVTALIESDSEEVNALLYGAMKAGLVVEAPGDNYDAELAKLRQLSLPQLEAALVAAKAKDSVLYNMGRPKGGPIEDFAIFLGTIYEEATNRPMGAWYDNKARKWKGPAIRFMRAGLAPFRLNITSRGLKALIDRIKTKPPPG